MIKARISVGLNTTGVRSVAPIRTSKTIKRAMSINAAPRPSEKGELASTAAAAAEASFYIYFCVFSSKST
jgi:hypothetical protein